MPGAQQGHLTHWLVPILSEVPATLITRLRAEGFDAAQGTTSLIAVRSDGTSARPTAADWLAHTVYLPAYPELPIDELERLLSLLRADQKRGQATFPGREISLSPFPSGQDPYSQSVYPSTRP